MVPLERMITTVLREDASKRDLDQAAWPWVLRSRIVVFFGTLLGVLIYYILQDLFRDEGWWWWLIVAAFVLIIGFVGAFCLRQDAMDYFFAARQTQFIYALVEEKQEREKEQEEASGLTNVQANDPLAVTPD